MPVSIGEFCCLDLLTMGVGTWVHRDATLYRPGIILLNDGHVDLDRIVTDSFAWRECKCGNAQSSQGQRCNCDASKHFVPMFDARF